MKVVNRGAIIEPFILFPDPQGSIRKFKEGRQPKNCKEWSWPEVASRTSDLVHTYEKWAGFDGNRKVCLKLAKALDAFAFEHFVVAFWS